MNNVESTKKIKRVYNDIFSCTLFFDKKGYKYEDARV